MKHTVEELKAIANSLRQEIIKMIGYGKAGHFGGSCSLAEIVSVLYFNKMNHDPLNPKMPNRDRFLLSKAHSAPVQYAALAKAGYFSMEELETLKRIGSKLQGHPDMLKLPGIEANTGSLGQGLSIAAGFAAAAKIDNLNYKTYCIIGDGEMAEGQIWEAAMAASCYKLDNLVAILDRNGLQATGCIAERFNTGPVVQKWESFGWHVIDCDGHDIEQLIHVFEEADTVKGQPVMVLANTVKGKGISFAEHNVAFHNGMMTQEQYAQALGELEQVGGNQL
ncbi:transketolase [Sunxiuqinia sp. A32]|uniref:transketolase n=1 Tax=Sunxiuqinia sp. A32 TaxID=3461496 RepID=UPI0040457617